MAKKVTERSTKSEIYDAYMELKNQEKTAIEQTPVVKKVVEAKAKTVEKVKEMTIESLINDMAESKVTVMGTMEALLSRLNDEVVKFKEVQDSIVIAKEELENIYGIKEILSDLDALTEFKNTRRQQIDEEIASWKEQIAQLKVDHNSQLSEYKQKRERELEEFDYQLGIQRRNKRAEFEREIADYQEQIKTLEAEKDKIAMLEQKISENEAALNKAVSDAWAKATKEAQTKYEQAVKLTEQKQQSELALRDQEIRSRDEKITRLESEINELKLMNKELSQEVSAIAKASIEGASKAGQNITVSAAETGRR